MFKEENSCRDELIDEIVDDWNGKGFKWTWQEVANEVYKCLKIKVSDNACRKAYKRYKNDGMEKYKEVNWGEVEDSNLPIGIYDVTGKYSGGDGDIKLDKPKPKQFVSLEIKEDGTQISERKILMSETNSKSPEFCLIAHGFDPKLWEVISVKNNFWDMSDGDNGINTLYQSKLIVKPLKLNEELTLKDVKSFINVLSENKFEHNFNLITLDNDKEKYMLSIDWADIHVGSLSDEDEVGQNNDYKIAFGNIKKVVAKIDKILRTGKVEKIVHNFLGDFLHFDNVEGNTAGGTELDVDSRPFKMIKKAFEIAMYIIDNTACVPMEVNSVLGNHSMMVEFSVFWSLSLIYQDVKHIKFNVDEKSRKIMVYGKVLVGLTHGNNIAKTEQDLWLQNEFRQEWANCNYAEVHSGHLHQEILFSEKGGITKRTNPTLKIIDKYEHDHAWSSKKVVLGYLWHKEDNLQEIYYLK